MKQLGLFGEERNLLQEMRNAWRETIEHEGGHCPVCDRWGKVYARPINRTMARALLWLCRAESEKEGWVDVPAAAPRWLVRSNQLPTLRWWNLVERKEHEEDEKKYSGFWKPTRLGLDFVEGLAEVPKKVYTYKGEVEGFSDEKVKFRDCFQDLFDYEATMSEMA